MSSILWENDGPEDVVASKVLKRAEVGKIGRSLRVRLELAQYKTRMGWEDLTLDKIRPKVEELRKRRPTSSGAAISDSSSSSHTTQSEQHYGYARSLASSPLKGGAVVFSDQAHSRSGSRSSTGHRKRTHHTSFDLPSSSAASRKRFRSSPIMGQQSNNLSWKDTQSSPIKGRRQPYFTSSTVPGLSFFERDEGDELPVASFLGSDDEDTLPAHSFDLRSSPPRTPPPVRGRNGVGRHNKEKNGKSGEEGADLLLYLATSPSPANAISRSSGMLPPSTPPPKHSALPSSMMTTPGGSILAGFGNPSTPSQGFDFADFVNITPSPAQNGFSKQERIIKTPSSVARRSLAFNNLVPNLQSPSMRGMSGRESNTSDSRRVTAGLGVMQLGGDLRPR